MKSSRYTPEQVAFGLRQAELGTPVSEICRKMGISEQTFCRWTRGSTESFNGMDVAEVRWLRVLREENRKLRQLVAHRTLDRQMLQDVPRKESSGLLSCGPGPDNYKQSIAPDSGRYFLTKCGQHWVTAPERASSRRLLILSSLAV